MKYSTMLILFSFYLLGGVSFGLHKLIGQWSILFDMGVLAAFFFIFENIIKNENGGPTNE